jgi:hypothetical protein
MNMPAAKNATRLDTFFSVCRVLDKTNETNMLRKNGSEGTTRITQNREIIF